MIKYKSRSELIQACDALIYENSRHIAKTRRFLWDLENDLLLAEAELIAGNYEKKIKTDMFGI